MRFIFDILEIKTKKNEGVAVARGSIWPSRCRKSQHVMKPTKRVIPFVLFSQRLATFCNIYTTLHYTTIHYTTLH